MQNSRKKLLPWEKGSPFRLERHLNRGWYVELSEIEECIALNGAAALLPKTRWYLAEMKAGRIQKQRGRNGFDDGAMGLRLFLAVREYERLQPKLNATARERRKARTGSRGRPLPSSELMPCHKAFEEIQKTMLREFNLDRIRDLIYAFKQGKISFGPPTPRRYVHVTKAPSR
ncbi:MAG: hypothetical protein RIM33_11725 [Alphaproteobacteria bacterium]